MLSELFTLQQSLSSRGIQAQAWHPWMQSFKKGEALVAELDPSGQVAAVSFLDAKQVEALRNIVPDNQKSFPGFNLNCPLLRVSDSIRWHDYSAQWEFAAISIKQPTLAYETKDLKRINRLLHEFPQREIAPRLRNAGVKLRSVTALLERLASNEQTAERFLRELALKTFQSAELGRTSREFALSILFGKPNRKKRELEDWKITLILDVADLENFSYRVADPTVGNECNVLLLASEQGSEPSSDDETFICALSGRADEPVGDKMPQPNLPILGPSYLMSMNADIPCQTRYRQTSTNIFPAGRNTVRSLNDSLIFITEDSRRNRTWAGVPSGTKDTSDLLIAYMEDAPLETIPITALFTEDESDPQQKVATFEKRVEEVYEALRVRGRLEKDISIRIVAITRIDKGRRQVIFNASYAASAIFEAQHKWKFGTRNVPEIFVPFPRGKGQPPEWRTNQVPSPSAVMLSFKAQWIRAGTAQQTIPGVELRQVYELLLLPNAETHARALLDRYMPLTIPLLDGLARSLRGGPYLPEGARSAALVVVSVYGILLSRQGRQKEVYMQGREYFLGQFLQYADLLHKLYCESERENKFPPQLLGNAVLPMAIQDPVRAFEVLSTRMPVYLAWAERAKGEKAGLAKWTRNELGRIAGLLKDHNLTPAVNASGKAELLLGYLAKAKSKEGEN